MEELESERENFIKEYKDIEEKIFSFGEEQRNIGEKCCKVSRQIVKEKKLLSKLHWEYRNLKGKPIINAIEEWDSSADEDLKELYKLTEYFSFDHFVPFYFGDEENKHRVCLNFNDEEIYIKVEIGFDDKRNPLIVLFDFCKEWDIEVDYSPLEKVIINKKKECEMIKEILEKIKI